MSDTPTVGHNVAHEKLRTLVERIERLEEEKKTLASDIKDIYQEANSNGFNVKVLRALIRLRSKDPDDLSEEEILLETYRRALG